MRDALLLPGGHVITVDNSAAIGEKENDIVKVSNELAAYYTIRVALLEQWSANAEPQAISLANFSGDNAWQPYINGIHQAFKEIGAPMPPITGSTETNMSTLQSGLSITIIGRKLEDTTCASLVWYVYGQPLVGQEVLEQPQAVADLGRIYNGWQRGLVKKVWPVGSSGVAKECERLFPNKMIKIEDLDLHKTAGPATVVLLASHVEDEHILCDYFGLPLKKVVVQA